MLFYRRITFDYFSVILLYLCWNFLGIFGVPSKIEFLTRWINPDSVSTLIYRVLSGSPRTGRPSIHWTLYLLSISHLNTLVEFRECWNVMCLFFVTAVFDIHCSKTSIRFLELFWTIFRGNNYMKLLETICFKRRLFWFLCLVCFYGFIVNRWAHARAFSSSIFLRIFVIFSIFVFCNIFYAINSSTWFIFLYICIFQYLKISFNSFHEVEIIHRLSKRMSN